MGVLLLVGGLAGGRARARCTGVVLLKRAHTHTHTHTPTHKHTHTLTHTQVGVHGSALYNAFFMPLHSSLVEIRPYQFSGEWPNMYMKVWGGEGGGPTCT